MTIPQVGPLIFIGINRSYDASIPDSYVDRSVHRIFKSQTFGIGLGLSVIFPSYLQTTSLLQTLVLTSPLNQVSKK